VASETAMAEARPGQAETAMAEERLEAETGIDGRAASQLVCGDLT
jgi:hypothetical protein